MLVIRFNRVGRKNHAQYRIVVQEKSVAPGGRHVAMVGSYDPHSKAITLKEGEIKQFIANGAQPSDSVHNLLVREGVIDAPKRALKLPEKEAEEQPEEEKADDAVDASEDAAETVEEEKAEEK